MTRDQLILALAKGHRDNDIRVVAEVAEFEDDTDGNAVVKDRKVVWLKPEGVEYDRNLDLLIIKATEDYN